MVLQRKINWKNQQPNFTLRKVTTDKDEGSYHVQVTNEAGIVNSESFEVTVSDPVLVDTPPQNKTAATGSSVTLEVAVSEEENSVPMAKV